MSLPHTWNVHRAVLLLHLTPNFSPDSELANKVIAPTLDTPPGHDDASAAISQVEGHGGQA